MKLEDIKKEMPKTPEMIHNRIQDEIKRQMENEQIAVFPTPNAKKTKWSRAHVAAVAAVCILGVIDKRLCRFKMVCDAFGKTGKLIRWQQRFQPMNRAR